ncbi:hypothetical protein BV22DRAFT_915178 [Leucogyrophana mollusca]|uniref:Uncharacterized protein n=1 Tax=Leucogyrophana mollusca TaxID=85980 RepID=A0ACB8B015_9AGAM|nr:hypothetical protein BV22DRAFT_915178 [Leucogyrophana mollusca]
MSGRSRYRSREAGYLPRFVNDTDVSSDIQVTETECSLFEHQKPEHHRRRSNRDGERHWSTHGRKGSRAESDRRPLGIGHPSNYCRRYRAHVSFIHN